MDSNYVEGYGLLTIRPAGGQPPTGLLAAWRLAALKANLVILVTMNK
jgi:hypothetical protein